MLRHLSLAAAALTVLTSLAAESRAGNPAVHGSSSVSHRYDPFTDTHYVDTERNITRRSAYDRDRHHVDHGSYRYVDRIVVDEYGRRCREYGYVWTSYGKPHGRLTRDCITVHEARRPYDPYGPGPRRIDRDRSNVVFAPNPNGVVNRNRATVTFGQRQTANFAPVPGRTVNQNRRTVDFAPAPTPPGGTVRRDRSTAVFAPNPGTVQRDRTAVNFGAPR